MKKYTTVLELEKDIKLLDLERKIAIEELKEIKNKYLAKFMFTNITLSVLKYASKYGITYLIKHYFKRKSKNC